MSFKTPKKTFARQFNVVCAKVAAVITAERVSSTGEKKWLNILFCQNVLYYLILVIFVLQSWRTRPNNFWRWYSRVLFYFSCLYMRVQKRGMKLVSFMYRPKYYIKKNKATCQLADGRSVRDENTTSMILLN